MIQNEKYKGLVSYLKSFGSAVVAFSGGVDSTFLIYAAKEALGANVVAVTVVAPYIPKWEVKEATALVKELNIEHHFIYMPVVPKEIERNPSNRCYLCKTAIFQQIKEFAKGRGLQFILDGSNADDTKDYRPGLRALKELNIKSPLLERGLTKEEIRAFSKEAKLPTWDKPAYACLLSRIPYDEEIKVESLERIEKAEKYLMELGFRAVRVRCHQNLARIEVPKKFMDNLFKQGIVEDIVENLKTFGFQYVTLDLQGYRMGSLNENLLK